MRDLAPCSRNHRVTRVFESTPERLRAEALYHEDVDDPGDASMLELLLTQEGDLVHFTIEIPAEGLHEEVAALRRKDCDRETSSRRVQNSNTVARSVPGFVPVGVFGGVLKLSGTESQVS